MRVVITGGSGFLGDLLAHELLARTAFCGGAIDELVLLDRVTRSASLRDARVRHIEGDLIDSIHGVFEKPVDMIFHLAAAVSADSEADFDLGMRNNLEATHSLLEAARTQHAAGGPLAAVIFASSVAVYGSDPELPQPELLRESDIPLPGSSYGSQKAICELLTADYSRKGFIDGRVVRLMTVAIRPGAPNGAASGFVSGIIREPLNGLVTSCPVNPSLEIAVASPRTTINGLIKVAEAGHVQGTRPLNGRLPVNLPALTVSVAQMLGALRRIAGDSVADLVQVHPDLAVEKIVGSWPARFDNSRASALGISGDDSIDDVIHQYIADYAPLYSYPAPE